MSERWALLGPVVALSLVVPVQAAELRIGVTGGVGRSKLVDTPRQSGVSFTRSTGPVAGGLIEYGMLRVETKFVDAGGQYRYVDSAGVVIAGRQALSYLAVPVMFNGVLFKSKPVRPHVMAGFNPGFLLTAKVVNGRTRDIKDFTRKLDLGITAAVGIQTGVGKSLVEVDGRLTSGLNRTNKNGALARKTNNFQLTASIVIPVGSK